MLLFYTFKKPSSCLPSPTTQLIKPLQQKLFLSDLCHHYNIELQGCEPDTKKLYGYCPFHEDSTLSLIIKRSTNRWKSMRACCGGGDNIQFVMKLENISFREAVEKLLHFVIQNSSIKNKNNEKHKSDF